MRSCITYAYIIDIIYTNKNFDRVNEVFNTNLVIIRSYLLKPFMHVAKCFRNRPMF